jgi:crotonobetainyl-CoA:carnitine CoA-transferase CaiB-like acyl-CoA transferase
LDEQYDTNVKRRAHRTEIADKIQAVLYEHPRAHWLSLFEGVGVPAGPINRIDEIVADPQLHDRGFFYAMDVDGRQIPQVGLGIRFDGKPSSPRLPPPALGEHTEEVLRDWGGFAPDEVAALRRDEVI